jgi:hypothetical protein
MATRTSVMDQVFIQDDEVSSNRDFLDILSVSLFLLLCVFRIQQVAYECLYVCLRLPKCLLNSVVFEVVS